MNEEGRKAGTEVFFSCLPDFLIQKVFQALESFAEIFPSLGKFGADFSKAWKTAA